MKPHLRKIKIKAKLRSADLSSIPTQRGKVVSTIYLNHTRRLTCPAFHPREVGTGISQRSLSNDYMPGIILRMYMYWLI